MTRHVRNNLVEKMVGLYLVVLALLACGQDAPSQRSPIRGAAVNPSTAGNATATSGQTGSLPQSLPPASTSASISPSVTVPSPSVVADDTYGSVLSLKGHGNLKAGGVPYPIVQDLTVLADAQSMAMTVDEFHADGTYKYSPNIEEAVKTKTGTTTYSLASTAELTALQSAGKLHYEPFLYYVKSVKNSDGSTLAFTPPLPFMVVPAAATRYESLTTETSAIEFSSVVSGDGQPYTGTITFRKKSETNGVTTLTSEFRGSDERGGLIFEKLPLPTSATYTVDTNKKRLTAYEFVKPYMNQSYRETISLKFGLCHFSHGNTDEAYTCK